VSHPNMAAMYHQPASLLPPPHRAKLPDEHARWETRLGYAIGTFHIFALCCQGLEFPASTLYSSRTTHAKDLGSRVIRSCALVSPRALNPQWTCAAIVDADTSGNDR
jgi:hypothetical protein